MLLACHLFFHLTKLLAAPFLRPECAGSLSWLDHVFIGQHLGVSGAVRDGVEVGLGLGPLRSSGAGEWSTVDRCFVYIELILQTRGGGGVDMKDGLNMKVAPNPLTEHICCIVPADYIFFLLFPNKLQASTIHCLCTYLLKERKMCFFCLPYVFIRPD